MVDKLNLGQLIFDIQACYNDGEWLVARNLCLRGLAQEPNNPEMLYLFGVLNYRQLKQPWVELFLKLKSMDFDPDYVLDLGAYDGRWTRLFKSFFPSAHVLMIEAQSKMEGDLAKTCHVLNGVEYYIQLLGDKDRDAVIFFEMDTPYGSTGSSIYSERTPYYREQKILPMLKLDSLIEARGPTHFKFVKIDVQGAEIDVLKGGIATLLDVEFVLVEISVVEYNKGSPLFADVIQFMKTLGFIFFDTVEDHRVSRKGSPYKYLCQLDVLFVRETSDFRAVL